MFKAYLITHLIKQRLHPLPTETSKCSSLPQLCNTITWYFIRHTFLRWPDSLQHGQDMYMGGTQVKVGVLYVLFQGKFATEIFIKEGERWAKTAEEKMTFKYHFLRGRFHMLIQSYKLVHSLCLNNLPQVFLICNQWYQVSPLRYINRADEVFHLVRGRKVLGGMKYLMRWVKVSA